MEYTDQNIDYMLRLNGEVRDREKVMRGLKKMIHLFYPATKCITTISGRMKALEMRRQLRNAE